jgi:hypothetical protein
MMEPVKVPMPRQAKYEEEQEHMRRISRIDGKSQDVRREY